MRGNNWYQQRWRPWRYQPSGTASAAVTTWFVTRESTTFVVPSGVTSLDMDAVGEGGQGSWRGRGGGGARVQSTLAVTPAESLTINLNTGGGAGGLTGFTGGKGGGYAGILRSATPLAIAAGGGGGATTDAGLSEVTRYGWGGAGGESGQDGVQANSVPQSYPGLGATPSAGGAGGTGGTGLDGADGSALTGGAAGNQSEGGGGGGAGLYGGGGGESGTDGAGGGGGSSLGDTITGGNYRDPAANPYGAGWGGNPTGVNAMPITQPYNVQAAGGVVRIEWAVETAPPAALSADGVLSVYVPRWQLGTAYPAALELQAGSSAGLSAGDPVPRLIDWTGGLHMDQGTLAQQPTLETAGTPDGVAALYADGTSWLESVAAIALGVDTIVIAVWQPSVTGQQVLLEQGPSISTADGLLITSVIGSAQVLSRVRRGGTNADANGTLGASVPGDYLTVVYTTSGSDAGARDVTVDGGSVVTSTTGTLSEQYRPGTLHMLARSGGSVGVTGYLRGLAILDGSASSETIAAVTALLEGDD